MRVIWRFLSGAEFHNIIGILEDTTSMTGSLPTTYVTPPWRALWYSSTKTFLSIWGLLWLITHHTHSTTAAADQCNITRDCGKVFVQCTASSEQHLLQRAECNKTYLYDEMKIVGVQLSRSSFSHVLDRELVANLHTTKLTIKQIALTHICDGVFTSTGESLRHLDLADNTIESVAPSAFQGLQKLRVLNLSLNYLTSIPGEAINQLVGLQELYLTSNRIENITKTDFQNLNNLTILDLSYNKLITLQHGSITHMPSLQQLYISGNQFQCDCDLIWLRHHQMCLCVLNYDNCATANMTQFSLVSFPISTCEVSADDEPPCRTDLCQLVPTDEIAYSVIPLEGVFYSEPLGVGLGSWEVQLPDDEPTLASSSERIPYDTNYSQCSVITTVPFKTSGGKHSQASGGKHLQPGLISAAIVVVVIVFVAVMAHRLRTRTGCHGNQNPDVEDDKRESESLAESTQMFSQSGNTTEETNIEVSEIKVETAAQVALNNE